MECFECITKSIESKRNKQNINCPYCGCLQSNDDYQYPVTYWAEDGSQEMECDSCQQKFWIREHVDRWYEVGKKLDELGYPE